MSDQHKSIVRRESVAAIRRVPAPGEVTYSITNDAAEASRQVWTALRRQWRFGVAIFVLIMSAVSLLTLLRPTTYRASGLLEIRPENADALPVATLFGPQRLAGESLATQFGILKSVTLAERVVAEGHLDSEGPSWMARLSPLSWFGKAADDDTQQKVEQFQSHLIVSPQEGSRLVRVDYEDSDPRRAAAIVNSVLSNYLRLRAEDTERTGTWLGQQRDQARTRLAESQRGLQDYVRKHGLQVFETGQGETENLVNDRLKQLHAQLTDAQAERYSRQSTYEQVSRRSMGAGSQTSPVIESLSIRLAELEREAAGLSATFHDDYPRLQEVRKQARAVQAAINQERDMVVTRSQREYQAAMRKESLLTDALSRQQQSVQALEGSSAGYAAMRREVTTNQQLYDALDQKMKEVSISAALKATNVGVVDYAKPPRKPYQSPLVLNLAVGLILGLIGGIGGALVRDYTDNRVRRVEDVDGFMGVPAVGVIPQISLKRLPRNLGWALKRSGESIVWGGNQAKPGYRKWFQIDRGHRDRPVLADAFAALRSAVVLRQDSPSARSLLITSPGIGEGKTTVSVNLALSLARLGRRVLLIDGDLRHPNIHEALGVTHDRGLSSYLAGEGEWAAAIHSDVLPNLSVMPAGNGEGEPGDLLASDRMQRLVLEASQVYDHVVIDSPPMLPHLADARILSNLTDGVLLTVRGGSTPRDVALRAISQLHHVVGVVVNGYDVRETPPYYRDAWHTGTGTVA